MAAHEPHKVLSTGNVPIMLCPAVGGGDPFIIPTCTYHVAPFVFLQSTRSRHHTLTISNLFFTTIDDSHAALCITVQA